MPRMLDVKGHCVMGHSYPFMYNAPYGVGPRAISHHHQTHKKPLCPWPLRKYPSSSSSLFALTLLDVMPAHW